MYTWKLHYILCMVRLGFSFSIDKKASTKTKTFRLKIKQFSHCIYSGHFRQQQQKNEHQRNGEKSIILGWWNMQTHTVDSVTMLMSVHSLFPMYFISDLFFAGFFSISSLAMKCHLQYYGIEDEMIVTGNAFFNIDFLILFYSFFLPSFFDAFSFRSVSFLFSNLLDVVVCVPEINSFSTTCQLVPFE